MLKSSKSAFYYILLLICHLVLHLVYRSQVVAFVTSWKVVKNAQVQFPGQAAAVFTVNGALITSFMFMLRS